MAVMGAVREIGLSIVKPLGAPAGHVQTFIEVPFKTDDDRTCYPDGLVQSTRAGRVWTSLVEVKTGAAELERLQVETYLDIARDNGFDAVLTVSNQLSPAPGVHPVEVDRRKLRRVSLHHLSWAEILTTAVQQRVHRGVSNPDQAWILGELIRYLEHPRSGALDFSDMGAAWVPVREAVAAGTLRSNDKGLADVVSRWEQLLRFAALRLGRELGADVQVAVSRKEAAEPSLRIAAQTKALVGDGVLSGTLRIPDAAAPLDVAADVRSGRVTVSADVDAPRDGRALTRVNWLVRQLREAPDGLRIDAYASGARSSTSELLRVVRGNPTSLITDPKRVFRSFRITATSPLGTKRGLGRGGFIDSVLAAVDGFYAAVLQELRPWTPKAPQLPRVGRTAAEEAGIDIAPPPSDLLEQPTEEELGEPVPPEAEAPRTVITEAVEHADDLHADTDDHRRDADGALPHETGNAVTARAPEPEPADDEQNGGESFSMVSFVPAEPEVVSWDAAQDRLDDERAAATVDREAGRWADANPARPRSRLDRSN
ncbi:MAG: stress response protein [Acidimicrobiales bacterium]